ncbi:MAG TPA: FAD-dependent oxidoreductase [Bryobacteraceae bacterium]|nr:FAD-dependent oxidoreductase [Bryobacteraceae bacterium]HXR78337.1 FAD-dependent oxidoreductase [Bryobacteraceae bacterium]
MSEPMYDVVIAGAGIVGAACAYECAREGLKVAVLERDFIGAGATAAGMGHVVVMDDSEAQFALTRYSQQLWQELASELPDDCEYVQTGTLWVAADEEEMSEVRRKHQFYSQRKVPSEILDARSLDAAEPQLRTGLAGALFVKEDAVVYPPCVARYLLERARDLGARVLMGRQVIRLDDEGAGFDDGTVMKGAVMVNAAGAHAASVHPDLPIVPRKGHLLITERYPGFVRHQLIELGYLKSAHKSAADSVAFNIQPRKTGQLLIGSSRQYGVDSPEIDRSILSRMLARATQYIPTLAGLSSLRVWTGLRAATPDNLPLIGRCPGYRYVFAAAGHEGLGITTSLATARLLIDELMSRSPAISPEPYSVQRNTAVHG